jgi:type I restriction enzyme, S subunit
MKRGYKETEIGEIPIEWEMKKIGDVCIECRERNDGLVIAEDKLSGVFKDKGLIPMRDRVKGETIDRCKIVEPNSFAYNPMRINIGSIAKNTSKDTLIVSPDYVVFKTKSDKISYHYLEQFRRSSLWGNFITSSGDGGVRIRIYFSHLSEMDIPLPPLPEQKKIAEVLSSVDESIRATQEVIDQAKVLKQGMLNRLLTKGIGHKKFKMTEIGEIPVEWEVEQYKNICEINRESLGGSTPDHFIIKYIDLSCVIETGVLSEPVEYSYKNAPSRARRCVKNRDVLVSTVRPNLRGFAFIEVAEKNLIASTGFAVLSAMNNCLPDFLWQNILSDCFMDQIIRLTVGSNYPAVNSTEISELFLPLPPLHEQEKIANLLSSVDIVIKYNTEHLEQLKSVKTGLMQDLLTGIKRVQ